MENGIYILNMIIATEFPLRHKLKGIFILLPHVIYSDFCAVMGQMGQFEMAGIPLESCISLYKNYIILGDPSKLNLHVWSIPKHLNVLY